MPAAFRRRLAVLHASRIATPLMTIAGASCSRTKRSGRNRSCGSFPSHNQFRPSAKAFPIVAGPLISWWVQKAEPPFPAAPLPAAALPPSCDASSLRRVPEPRSSVAPEARAELADATIPMVPDSLPPGCWIRAPSPAARLQAAVAQRGAAPGSPSEAPPEQVFLF